jgi:hypothetical protein
MGESEVHPNYYVSGAVLSDPTVRLGVMMSYISRHDLLEKFVWGRVKGEQNAKRTNSLVDILDGKSGAYTKCQPRRFLRKGISPTLKPCYTDNNGQAILLR